jgi:lysophospholipase L1-like esterase
MLSKSLFRSMLWSQFHSQMRSLSHSSGSATTNELWITGQPAVGVALTANSLTPGSYQWQADGVDIPGATGSEYTPVVGDVGAVLTVRDGSAISPATDAVLAVTHHVSTAGNDTTGDGSSGAPWRTLWKALHELDGTTATVLVEAGNYYTEGVGGGFIDLAGETLTFIANGQVNLRVNSACTYSYAWGMTGAGGGTLHFKGKFLFDVALDENGDATVKYLIGGNRSIQKFLFTECEFNGNNDTRFVLGNTGAKWIELYRCTAKDFASRPFGLNGGTFIAESCYFENIFGTSWFTLSTMDLVDIRHCTSVDARISQSGTVDYTTVNLYNNFWSTLNESPGSSLIQLGIADGAEEITNLNVDGNAIFKNGMPEPRSGISYNGIEMPGKDSYYDVTRWLDPGFTTAPAIGADSFLTKRGVSGTSVARDIEGKPFDATAPCIGCYHYAGAKKVVTPVPDLIGMTGDSFTSGGTIVTDAQRYTTLIENALTDKSWVYMPGGNPGDMIAIYGTATKTISKMGQEFAQSSAPQAITFLGGVNDMADEDDATIASAIIANLDAIADLGVTPIYCGTQAEAGPGFARGRAIEDLVEAHCISRGYPYVLTTKLLVAETGWYDGVGGTQLISGDTLHPTVAGHIKYAEWIGAAIEDAVSPIAPTNSVAPSLVGGGAYSIEHSVDLGTWAGTAPITYGYKWFVDGALVSESTTYTPTSGASMYCRVTATNAGGSLSVDTAAVALTSEFVNARLGSFGAMVDGTGNAGNTVTYFPLSRLPVASTLTKVEFYNAAAAAHDVSIMVAVPSTNGWVVSEHQVVNVSGVGVKTFTVADTTLDPLELPANALVGFYSALSGSMRYYNDSGDSPVRYWHDGYCYATGKASGNTAMTSYTYYNELKFAWEATAVRAPQEFVVDESFTGTTQPWQTGLPSGATAWSYGPIVGAPELFTNGTFDANVTGWSSGTYVTGNSALAWNAGKARVERLAASGLGNAAIWQTITKPSSGYVRITGDITVVSGSLNPGAKFTLRNYYSGTTADTGLTGSGSFDVVLQTNGTLDVVMLYGYTGEIVFDVDNLSCRECDAAGNVPTGSGVGAVPGAAGIANRMFWQPSSNANKQTLQVDFQFTGPAGIAAIGKEPCLNTASVDYGSILAADIALNQLTMYNPWNNGSTLPIVRHSSALVNLTLAEDTPYRLELVIDGKTTTARITHIGSGVFDEFTYGPDNLQGYGHGRPSIFAISSGVRFDRVRWWMDDMSPLFVIYGDSITEGSGATLHSDCFAELLVAEAGGNGWYSGDGGVTAVSCTKAFVQDSMIAMPKYAIYYAGANNSNSDAERDNYAIDLARFVEAATALGVTPVVMLPTPINDVAKDARLDVMRSAAIASGANLIRSDLAIGSPDGSTYNAGLMSDTTHPNTAGHAALAARCLSDAPPAFGKPGDFLALGLGLFVIGSSFIIG